MNRRPMAAVVAIAAVAAAGVAVSAPAAGAAKKNEIRIVGGTVFKAGKYVKLGVRFKPANVVVKSGAVVTVKNKSTDPEPHTISFIERQLLPKSFDVDPGLDQKLMEAHQVDQTNEQAPPGVFVVDNGVAVPEGGMLEVDTAFSPDVAGDSAFIDVGQKTFAFKVTAPKGSKLFYYCAIHPWMQGKITVK